MLIKTDKNLWDSLLNCFHENEILEVRTRLRVQYQIEELLLWNQGRPQLTLHRMLNHNTLLFLV